MTVRLFDVEAQRAYEKEWEQYEQREQAKVKAGQLTYEPSPRPPEPMVDTREPRTPMHAMPTSATTLYPSTGQDMRNQTPIDKDGSAKTEPKGFETKWSASNSGLPFSIKE